MSLMLSRPVKALFKPVAIAISDGWPFISISPLVGGITLQADWTSSIYPIR
ncbi:hypothetical protein QNN00_06610 [Bacillus velezensis]|nr:hypothetical protein [Bacillus velezensis]